MLPSGAGVIGDTQKGSLRFTSVDVQHPTAVFNSGVQLELAEGCGRGGCPQLAVWLPHGWPPHGAPDAGLRRHRTRTDENPGKCIKCQDMSNLAHVAFVPAFAPGHVATVSLLPPQQRLFLFLSHQDPLRPSVSPIKP